MKTIRFFENRNIVSKRVRLARQSQKMSQQDLAARLQTMGVGIDQQGISKIENNQRIVTDYELVCLCKALSRSYEWMLEDIDASFK